MDDDEALSPRKVPKQSRAKATVDAIVTAAAQVLAGEGFVKTNTNRIARVAGVSIGSLYQYFPNKDALLAALINRYADRLIEELENHMTQHDGAPAFEQLRNYVRAMLVLPRKNPTLHRAFVLVALHLGHDSVRELEDRLVILVRQYLDFQAEHLLPTDLDLAAFIVVTTVEGVTNLALLKHPEYIQTEAFELELTRILWRYLVGGPE